MELGLFVKCPHPEMIEAMGIAGLDFAVVDMEHTPLGPRDLYPLVVAAERRQLELIVRIPEKEEQYFKWCRDLGVDTIQVPHVEHRGDLQWAVVCTQFQPVGKRGLCRFVRAADFSGKEKDSYLSSENARGRLILQIESVDAVQQLPSILDGIGSNTVDIFIGPYDLSQSMGKPGQIWDQEVVATIEGVHVLCRERGVRFGTFADSPTALEFWAGRGADFIEYGSDLALFLDAAKILKMLRNTHL